MLHHRRRNDPFRRTAIFNKDKPIHHMDKTDLKHFHRNHDKPQPIHYPALQINPVISHQTADNLAMDLAKENREANKHLMMNIRGVQLHGDKLLTATAYDKFVNGDNPTMKTLVETAALHSITTMVNNNTAVKSSYDKILSSLDTSERKVIENMLTNLTLKSIVNQQMPRKDDVMRAAVVEGAAYAIDNTDIIDRFTN